MALKPTQLPSAKNLRQQAADEIESRIDKKLSNGDYVVIGSGVRAGLPGLRQLLKKYGGATKVTFSGGLTFCETDSNIRRMVLRRYVNAEWNHVLFDVYQGVIYSAYLFK